ncbi:MAG: GAF domain-containing protein [Chloroflexota bacterium]
MPTNAELSSAAPVRLRADESAVLLEVAQAAGSTLDLHEVLERVAEKTARLTGADRCSLWLLDGTRDLLLPAAIYGIDPSFAVRWKRKILAIKDERLSQEAITTGQPVIVLDAASDPRTDKKAVDFFGDKSILVVPLASKGRVIGTLFLNHISRPYWYSPQEVAIIQAIASQAAVAIENAQLYEESRRSRHELLASFRRIGDALATGLDLADTLRLVVDLATEMLRATVGVLTLSPSDRPGDGTPGTTQWVPINAPDCYGPGLAPLTGLVAEVIDRGEPLYVADLREHFVSGNGFGPKESLRTYAGVPLYLRGEIIGTLGVFHALPKRFSPAEIDLLASFGAQAAIAIDNARLFARRHRQVEELSEAARRNADLYTSLQLEKKRLDVIFQHSTDAIYMVDRDGRIVAFNPAAEMLTGWSTGEALGHDCGEPFPGESNDPPTLSDATRRVLAEAATREEVVEAIIVNRSGNRRHVAASYAYVAASNGEGPFALAVVRDISRQKEVERLKSDFMSMVSHELRTPLAVIKGYAATLLNPSLHFDAERQTRFLRGINDASDRLTRLIDHLLAASRFESGRFKLNLQSVDLADIVHKVVGGMRTSAGAHGLRYVVPPEGVTARLDRDQIEQILINLITNAIKYSPDGGEVLVELRVAPGPLLADAPVGRGENPGDLALLSVRDHGIGIPSSQIRFVFDKFYRGDAPTIKRVPGTGLGLFICKSIVEAHHGSIWVESQSGRGSTFYVSLPREG